MKNTSIASTLGLAAVLIVEVSTTVAAQSEANKQAGSTAAQTATVKGPIVIRMAQEGDFPSLAPVSLQQAIQIALVQLPGGLLKAETEEENGAPAPSSPSLSTKQMTTNGRILMTTKTMTNPKAFVLILTKL